MLIASTKIKTTSQRGRLAVRTAPYFNTIAPRRMLGYAKLAGGGRWVVQVEIGRTLDGHPIRRREQLGLADDVADANGTDILTHEQALTRAIAWQPQAEGALRAARAFSVRDAVEQHRSFGGKRGDKTERAKLAAYGSLRWNVLCEASDGTPRPGEKGLGEVAVAELTTEMLVAWRDAMVRYDLKSTDERGYKASRASAERAWSNFRSALEQAYKKKGNGIPKGTADAWRNVETLGKVGNRREVHFSQEEALRYIDAARANGDTAEADLFEAYAWTGSRPGGELASLTVGDFNAKLHRLSIPERSETVISKTGARQITLTDEAVEFFSRITAGRSASAPLLSPDGVERWDARQRQVHFKAVLARAGAPKDAVPYSFRHSFISRWVEAGVSLKLIAENCGTSVGQIEQTYAKFLPDERRRLVQATAPKLRVVVSNDVLLKKAA